MKIRAGFFYVLNEPFMNTFCIHLRRFFVLKEKKIGCPSASLRTECLQLCLKKTCVGKRFGVTHELCVALMSSSFLSKCAVQTKLKVERLNL